jgi:hypothetical protein
VACGRLQGGLQAQRRQGGLGGPKLAYGPRSVRLGGPPRVGLAGPPGGPAGVPWTGVQGTLDGPAGRTLGRALRAAPWVGLGPVLRSARPSCGAPGSGASHEPRVPCRFLLRD